MASEQLPLPGAAPQPSTAKAPSPARVDEPAGPTVPQPEPQFEAMQYKGHSIPLMPLPRRRAAVTTDERLRTPHRFGSLKASTLTGILSLLDKGQPEEWSELCEFALTTDDHLFSCYETRIQRVVQAEYQIVPNQFGNRKQAQLAADLVNEQVSRIKGWRRFIREALHAEAIGFSCNETFWTRDAVSTQVYPERIQFVHPHRFRYDEQWVPRIYDNGQRRIANKALAGGSFGRYGEVLNPAGWVIHIGGGVAGYPSVGGYMRSCIWHWMFKRWIEGWKIGFLERYGSGKAHGTVPKGATAEVRQAALAALENWAQDGFTVLEEGSTIVFDAMDVATSGDFIYQQAVDYYERCHTKAILGTSDAVDPGANGSQAAVGARAGATMDPKMVSDGLSLCDTLHDQLFYWMCYFNRHLFDGGNVPPIPTMQFKTASDEVKTDGQDLADQHQVDVEAGNASPLVQVPGALDKALPAQATQETPSTALGDESAAMVKMTDAPAAVQPSKPSGSNEALEVVKACASGQIKPESAARMLTHFHGMDRATACELVGLPQPVEQQPMLSAVPATPQTPEPPADQKTETRSDNNDDDQEIEALFSRAAAIVGEEELRMSAPVKMFDPSQDRADDGQWTDGGSGGGSAADVGDDENDDDGEDGGGWSSNKPALTPAERKDFIKPEKDALKSALDAHDKNPSPEAAEAVRKARSALSEKRAAGGSANPDARIKGRDSAKKARLIDDANRAANSEDDDATNDAQTRAVEHIAKTEGKDAAVDQAKKFHAYNSDIDRLANVSGSDTQALDGYFEDGKLHPSAAREIRSSIKSELQEQESRLVSRIEKQIGKKKAKEIAKGLRPSPREVDAVAKAEVERINSDPDRLAEYATSRKESDQYFEERKKKKSGQTTTTQPTPPHSAAPAQADIDAVRQHAAAAAEAWKKRAAAARKEPVANSTIGPIDPKAEARSSQRALKKTTETDQTTMTSLTTGHSASILADVLRGKSVDQES